MNGRSKGKRSRRVKMLARLMELPPERRDENVKQQCIDIRNKLERRWNWIFKGNPRSKHR